MTSSLPTIAERMAPTPDEVNGIIRKQVSRYVRADAFQDAVDDLNAGHGVRYIETTFGTLKTMAREMGDRCHPAVKTFIENILEAPDNLAIALTCAGPALLKDEDGDYMVFNEHV